MDLEGGRNGRAEKNFLKMGKKSKKDEEKEKKPTVSTFAMVVYVGGDNGCHHPRSCTPPHDAGFWRHDR